MSQSIARFEYDPEIGKFRSWLYKIAKRTISRIQKRQTRQPVSTGESHEFRMIQDQPDLHDDVREFWEREYQKHLMEWAAEHIRPCFSKATWDAFWLTSVEEQSPREVATHLKISVGAVYVAKSRVMKRLAEKIREIDDCQ